MTSAIKVHPYWRAAIEEARRDRSRRGVKPSAVHDTPNHHRSPRGCFIMHPTKSTGYNFSDGRSAVLSLPTIFNPYHVPHGIATRLQDWPCVEEMKYEGDGRIATDILHRRFPGVPRVHGNDTVNWQQRKFLDPCAFENFWYPIPSEVDIFMKTHHIPEVDLTDAQGVEAIGQDLLNILNQPEDDREPAMRSSNRRAAQATA